MAFLLAPLAANASELMAAVNYAKKKTNASITISLTSLEGSAAMNNTFCQNDTQPSAATELEQATFLLPDERVTDCASLLSLLFACVCSQAC